MTKIERLRRIMSLVNEIVAELILFLRQLEEEKDKSNNYLEESEYIDRFKKYTYKEK